MTALAIPLDYKEECCQIFEKAKLLKRDFNPPDPDTNKYSTEDKAPLDRFIERQERAIDNASKLAVSDILALLSHALIDILNKERRTSFFSTIGTLL
jgi:hypothetical protein